MTDIQPANVHASQAAQEQEELEIDLLELMYRLLEKAKYIIAASILGAVLMGVITVFCITPKYTATSKLYVMNAGEAAINLADLQMGTYLAADYQEVFNNWHVHEMVIQKLRLPYTYMDMEEMLEVTNPSNTRILYIAITATDPLEAKQIADAYAAAAQEFIASTMDTKMPNLFEEALLPSAPSSPSYVRNILICFAAGLLLAAGIIAVQFMMDDHIHSSEEIDKYLGMSTLGVMPKQHGKGGAAKKKNRKEQ